MPEQTTGTKWWKWVLAVVGGLVILIVLIGIFADSEDDSTQGAARTTSVSIVAPPLSITAQKLYDEREANATRYDATYKGKTVHVSGQVVKIDGGDVTLGVDATGFGIDTAGFFEVALRDLSQEEQIRLNKGDNVSAVCKVGDYIIGTIMLHDCKLD